MNRRLTSTLAAGAFTVALAACSSSNQGAAIPQANEPALQSAVPFAKHTPAPSPAPSSSPAIVTGSVVELEDGRPLAGADVELYSTKAHAKRDFTHTDRKGAFKITLPALGNYLLVISKGQGQGAGDHAVVHDEIAVTTSPQTLAAPTLPPLPGVTPSPVQTGGAYRLARLTPAERSCIEAINHLRSSQFSARGVTADEWLTEFARAGAVSYASTNAAPDFSALTSYSLFNATGGKDACDAASLATDVKTATWIGDSAIGWIGLNAYTQANAPFILLGMGNPSNPLPTPTPSNPWP